MPLDEHLIKFLSEDAEDGAFMRFHRSNWVAGKDTRRGFSLLGDLNRGRPRCWSKRTAHEESTRSSGRPVVASIARILARAHAVHHWARPSRYVVRTGVVATCCLAQSTPGSTVTRNASPPRRGPGCRAGRLGRRCAFARPGESSWQAKGLPGRNKLHRHFFDKCLEPLGAVLHSGLFTWNVP